MTEGKRPRLSVGEVLQRVVNGDRGPQDAGTTRQLWDAITTPPRPGSDDASATTTTTTTKKSKKRGAKTSSKRSHKHDHEEDDGAEGIKELMGHVDKVLARRSSSAEASSAAVARVTDCVCTSVCSGALASAASAAARAAKAGGKTPPRGRGHASDAEGDRSSKSAAAAAGEGDGNYGSSGGGDDDDDDEGDRNGDGEEPRGSGRERERGRNDVVVWKLLGHLCKRLNVKEKRVRLHACQFLVRLLQEMKRTGIVIKAGPMESLKDALLVRIKDSHPPVRAEVINILLSFPQLPAGAFTELNKLMNDDPSVSIRLAVLKGIPLIPSSIPDIIQRSKDVAPEVRAFLYKTFGARCDLNSIKTPQLVLLLSRGLYDPSEIVRRDCLEAVREWMKSAPTDASDASTEEDSVFFTQLAWFSSRLEVEITESLTCTLFYAMMKMYNPGGKSFFQKFWSGTSAFSAETSLLFRMKCQYLHSSQQDLDSITPTISSYCEYVSQLFTNCVPSFIIKNLLIAACFLDFADEVGRRNMSKLIRDLLHSPVIPLRLVGPMIKVLYKIHDDISALSQIVAEIISDLQDPLASAAFDSMKYQNELQNQISTLTHLEDIRNDESIATSPWGLRAEFPLCITATIGYLQTELSLFSASTEEWARYNVLLHSLQLAEELLKYIPSGVSIKQYPAISSLLRDLFLPAVQHQMPGVRQEGVMCFGLFCLLDREAANNGFLLFTQIIQNDTTPIKITAIKLLFDMLLVFDFRGHTHVNLTGTKEGTFTRAIEILSGFIGGAELSRKQVAPESPDGKAPGTQSVALSTDRETEELLFTCVEGFAKLHLFHVLVSSEVIHKLFLELFHPRTRNWPKLRSCISGTLQEICTKSSECWEAVQRAILPCFLRIANSKDPDPFSRVPIDNVAQYLVKLVTSPSNPDQANCHTDTLVQFYRQLTLDILHEINSNPVSSGSHRLTTLLPYLDLSCHPPDFLQEILQLSTEIHSKLESGIYKTFVAQFSARIESMLNTTQNSSVPSSATSSVDPGVKALPRLSEALEQAMTPDVHRPPTKAVSDKGYQDFVLDQRKLLARIQSFELEGWDSPKKEKKEKKHRSTKQKEEEKPIRTDDVSAANGADLQQPDPQPDQASLHVRFSEGTKQEDAPTTSKPRKRKKDMEWLKQKVGILYSTPMSANTKRRRTVEQTPNEFVGVKNTTASRPTTTPLQPVIHQKNAALTPAPKTSHTVSKPPSTHVDTASATAAAHHANAEPHQVETSPPQPEAPCTTTSKIVVTCTGFTNNPQLEETLRKHVLTLGGEFIGGDTLHPRVTHVVTYSKHRTLKSVAAALCGFWIMTTSWVTDSALAGYFLPEKEFGTRYTQKPFAGKSFYLTPKFKSETPKSLVDNCTTFISLGKGVLATGECADYSLISAKSTDTGPGICFTAQQFFELIQPSSIKL